MPAKTPIYLKTSTPKRGKKLKLRDVLSGEMISPPLGDFRHSAHIGLDGQEDMFGELSFLQGKYDLIPSLGRTNASLTEDFPSHDSDGSFRPCLKSAVSLPVFNGFQSKERAPPKPPRLHLEGAPSQRSMSVSYGGGEFHRGEEDASFSSISQEESGRFQNTSNCSSEGSITGGDIFTPQETPASENWTDSGNILSSEDQRDCGVSRNIPACDDPMDCPDSRNIPACDDPMDCPDSRNTDLPPESLFGLELDLGPSILDEVLRIMDGYKAL